MDQLERPTYYEGEYLSADDLAAIVRYARIGQARHALGAHVWGIGIGLDLVERPLTGDDVAMVLTPGVAWDGLGRAIVAPVPQWVLLDLFGNFQDATGPAGVPVEIWLNYRELAAKPPGVGFSCPDDDEHGRVVETFRMEVRRTPVTDFHAVSIASRSIEASKALTTFDADKKPLFDESVPHQSFPESGDAERWPIFVGIVRWRKDAGQAGRFIKRLPEDLNAARKARRYIGSVAETIFAADGALRLRDRTKDPNDPIVNYQSPTVAPPNTKVVNDLVWCEGHLRVVGDARLQDGKLDYRVSKGGDDGVPIYLRRRFVKDPVMKTTLDAFIGPPAPPPAPVDGQTRFAVSTGVATAPKELLTVVTDGRVGINAEEPSNTLQVDGPTGIRYGFGYISGHADEAFTAFSFNAYKPNGAPWVFPDAVNHKSAALVLDDPGKIPEFKFQTNLTANPGAWKTHVVVKGDTGNVGIGIDAPAARLHVRSSDAAQGNIRLFTATAEFDYDGGGDHTFVFNASGGAKTGFLGGDVGIGTKTPLAQLHVAKAAHLNAIFDRTDVPEHLTVVVGSEGSGLRFSNTNEFFIGSQTYATRGDNTFGTEHLRIKADGKVGIGTTTPRAQLEIAGDNDTFGTAVFGIAAKGPNLSHIHWDPTGDWYIRSAATAGKVVIQDSGGNVGVGTSAPDTKLHVVGSRIRLGTPNKHLDLRTDGSSVDLHSETNHLYIRTLGDAAHPGRRHVIMLPDNANEGCVGIGRTPSTIFKLDVQGSVRASGVFVPSDLRLKKDIEPIGNPLDRLLALRGVSFAWREPEKFGDDPGPRLGFIAQEVEKVFPEWVKTSEEDEKAVGPIGLDALLVESVRELAKRCERLEAEVKELRAKLDESKPERSKKKAR